MTSIIVLLRKSWQGTNSPMIAVADWELHVLLGIITALVILLFLAYAHKRLCAHRNYQEQIILLISTHLKHIQVFIISLKHSIFTC